MYIDIICPKCGKERSVEGSLRGPNNLMVFAKCHGCGHIYSLAENLKSDLTQH